MTNDGIVSFAASELRANYPHINEVDATCHGPQDGCQGAVLTENQDHQVVLIRNGQSTPLP